MAEILDSERERESNSSMHSLLSFDCILDVSRQAPAALISHQDRLYLELGAKTSPISHRLFIESIFKASTRD